MIFFYPRQTYIFYSEGSSHPWIIFFFSFHLPASNRTSVGIESEFCRHRTGILSVSNWNSSGIEPEFCRHRTGILPAIEPFTTAFLPKEWGRNSLKVIQKSRNKTVSSIIIGYRWNAGIFPRCPPVEPRLRKNSRLPAGDTPRGFPSQDWSQSLLSNDRLEPGVRAWRYLLMVLLESWSRSYNLKLPSDGELGKKVVFFEGGTRLIPYLHSNLRILTASRKEKVVPDFRNRNAFRLAFLTIISWLVRKFLAMLITNWTYSSFRAD